MAGETRRALTQVQIDEMEALEIPFTNVKANCAGHLFLLQDTRRGNLAHDTFMKTWESDHLMLILGHGTPGRYKGTTEKFPPCHCVMCRYSMRLFNARNRARRKTESDTTQDRLREDMLSVENDEL